MADPIRLFISYAHEDLSYVEQLRNQLAGLERGGRIVVFDDGGITAGNRWDDTIKAELAGADVVVLMLSPSFFSSGYITRVEYEEALQREGRGELRIYPIVVRHLDLGAYEIQELQARPLDENRRLKPLEAWSGHHRGEVLAKIAAELRQVVSDIAEARSSSRGETSANPYAHAKVIPKHEPPKQSWMQRRLDPSRRARVLSAMAALSLIAAASLLFSYLQSREPPNRQMTLAIKDLVSADKRENKYACYIRFSLTAVLSKVKPDALRVFDNAQLEAHPEERPQKLLSGNVSRTGPDIKLALSLVDTASGLIDVPIAKKAPAESWIEAENAAAADLLEVLLKMPHEQTAPLLAKGVPPDTLTLFAETNCPEDPEDVEIEPEGGSPRTSSHQPGWFGFGLNVAHAEESSETDEKSIAALLHQYAKSLEGRKADVIAPLYTALNDRQRESLQRYLDNAEGLRVTISDRDMDIVVSGDKALATFTRTDTFKEASSDKPVELEVRLSLQLEKENGEWKIKGIKRPM